MLVDVIARARHQRLVDTLLRRQIARDVTFGDFDGAGAADQAETIKTFVKGGGAEGNFAVGPHGERSAVEDQLVLPADHVDIDDGNFCFADAIANRLFPLPLRLEFVR